MKKPVFTEADGRQLAVDMLRELAQWDRNVDERECAKMDADHEPDMREVKLCEDPEILRRYLATVQGTKSPALERGFLCMLTAALTSEELSEGFMDGYDRHTTPRPGLKFERR